MLCDVAVESDERHLRYSGGSSLVKNGMALLQKVV